MQNFNIMGHIKISQIKIPLIENVEKYIGTCITKFLFLLLRKPNLSLIIEAPYIRHDDGRRITWLFIGDDKHVPLHIQHSLYCFNIQVVHLGDFPLNFHDYHNRLLLESKLLVEEHLPTRIHFSNLTYPNSGKPQKGKSSPSFTKFPLRVPRFFLIPS